MDVERHPEDTRCRLASVRVHTKKEGDLTVTPDHVGAIDAKDGGHSGSEPSGRSHSVLIGYISAVAALLTALATLLSVMLR